MALVGGAAPTAVAPPLPATRVVIGNAGGSDLKVHSLDYAADAANRYIIVVAGYERLIEATMLKSGSTFILGFPQDVTAFYLASDTDLTAILEWG